MADALRKGQRLGERFVGTIDIADPADVHWALDRGWRIAWDAIFDGGTYSVAEPCAANCFVDDEPESRSMDLTIRNSADARVPS